MEIVEAGAASGRDAVACLLFIHHTAPENAAIATRSSPTDWTSIEGPAVTAVEAVAGSGIPSDVSIAGWPHRHCANAPGTRRLHAGHTQLELMDLLSGRTAHGLRLKA
jgi:hypothetical protein